jgi:hypothetical protein
LKLNWINFCINRNVRLDSLSSEITKFRN